jgi:hypothetical protein
MDSRPELYLIGKKHVAQNPLKIYEPRDPSRCGQYRAGALHPREISMSELVELPSIPAGTEFQITFVPSIEDFQKNHLASPEISANGKKELTTLADIQGVIGFWNRKRDSAESS